MSERDAVADSLPEKGAAPWRLRASGAPDLWFGYGRLSLALHWLTLIAVVALVLVPRSMHATIGIWIALPLVWRVTRRFARGFPRVPDQPVLLNLTFRLAMITLLVALLSLAVTGTLLWFIALDVQRPAFLAAIQAWLAGNPAIAETVRQVHFWSWQAGLVGFALHMLAAVKHIITAKDGVLRRIVKPVRGAR